MKNKLIYIIINIMAFGFFSCEDQTDIYQDFVDASKGKVYPGKVINPAAYSGNERIKIEFTKPIDPSVTEVRVFWNFFNDSISVPLNGSDSRKEILLNNLDEKSYSFIIKAYDNQKNISVPIELFGNSYGQIYQNRLSNRTLKNIANNTSTKVLTLTFGDADISNGAFQTTVRYTDSSDKIIVLTLPVKESVLTITNYKSNAQYSTQYKPEATSIDIFTTTWSNVF